jgi:pimeloyl-ACP methyl ester carboxylesterase
MNPMSISKYLRRASVGIRIAAVTAFTALTTVGLIAVASAAGEDLPSDPARALHMERENALPLTRFYDTPMNFAQSKPGDLLSKEPATAYQLPAGASAVRMLYHSLGAEGEDVAASAAILIPAGPEPTGGWPMVVWAHGTSGVARQCAPSAMADVYYRGLGLFDFLEAGIAVVAVDYHGLGTTGAHQYIDKVAQANDVIYAVPAAHAAVAALGKKWVVDGHSQGGLAAWGVAEREAVLKQPDYLGAVSVSAATLHDGWMVSHPNNSTDAGFYAAWVAFGIHARFAAFRPDDMLSAVGAKHYAAITQNGCWLYGHALYSGRDFPAMVKAGWSENPWVQKFFAENRVGDAPIAGPVFAIAGEGDTAVPIAAVRDVVDRVCRHHRQVQFRSYPGLEHDQTMLESMPDQIAWIKDRFAGKPVPGNCPR